MAIRRDQLRRVVPPKDPQAVALVEVGTESRRRLGVAARQRIDKHYSLSTVIAVYKDLYEVLTETI